MEKASKLMGSKILKFLSKAAQPAVTFHSPPPSPRKTSGPMIPIFPAESRRKTRSGITFASKEPTSPKVSCMGQVHGKKKKKKKIKSKSSTSSALVSCVSKEVKNKPARVSSKVPKEVALPEQGNKNSSNSARGPERVPSLGQMKRFASGRSALADFDSVLEVRDDQRDDVKQEVGGEEDEDHGEIIKEQKKEVALRKWRTFSSHLLPLQL